MSRETKSNSISFRRWRESFSLITAASDKAGESAQIALSQTSPASARADRNTRVFLSYSRKDAEFAKWLRHGLQEGHIEVFQDIEDTLPGEEWWRRLQGLINQADTVIFVLSPYSVSSAVCRNEVAHALKLNKRVFPVVIEDINWATAPDGLIKLHGVFFNDPSQRDEALRRLIEALQTDISWIREHTRLGELAQHWDAHDRPSGDLLRGSALEEAEHWLTQRPKTARSPSNLHQEYIRASRTAARQRGRTLVAASLAIAIATSSLGVVAWLQKTEVQSREAMLLREKSRMLTEFARQNLRDGDPVTAALLAIDALPDETDLTRPYFPSAEFVLHRALRERRERHVLGGRQYIVREAIFSPDERFVLTAENDGRVLIWDAITGREQGELRSKGNRGARTIKYSPDERQILVGYDDGIVRVFDATMRNLLLELQTPSTSIRVAIFGPDGRRILTAGEGDSGTIWDVAAGKIKVRFAGRAQTVVEGAAFNRDGSKVVTVSNDRTARIWNTHDGRELVFLEGQVRNAVFSPDGQQILTASGDKGARLWDGNGNEIMTLAGHNAPTLFADFSPDGKYIVTSSADRTSRLWEFPLREGEPVRSYVLLGHTDGVQKASFSKTGNRLLTVSDDLSVRIWQVENRVPIATLKGHQRIITSAIFNKDGRTVLTASDDSTARIWTTEPTSDSLTLDGEEAALFASFSTDSKRLVTTYEDGTARIWSGVKERSSEVRLKGHREAVISAYFNNDATQILTASNDETARIWNVESGRELAQLRIGSSPVAALLSPDGRFVLTATRAGTVTLWQAEERLKDFKSNDSELFGVAFSPNGEKIVIASDNHARIWNTESGKPLKVLDGHTRACRTAAFSSDGQRVLTAGDTTARIWDATTGTLMRMQDIRATVLAAEFDPQGHRVLIVAQRKPFAYLWDLETDKVLELSGVAAGSPEDGAHTEQVTQAMFSADGRRIVTASRDGSVRVWDAQTRVPIDVLKHPKAVSFVAISPDMRWIATMSWDGITRLWPNFVSTQEFVAQSRDEIPRCLTPEQRQRFGLGNAIPSWCQTRPK